MEPLLLTEHLSHDHEVKSYGLPRKHTLDAKMSIFVETQDRTSFWTIRNLYTPPFPGTVPKFLTDSKNLQWLQCPSKLPTFIQKLDINVSGCWNYPDISIKLLFDWAPLQKLQHVTNLSLNFSNCRSISNSSLNFIFSLFSHIKSLQRFSLNLSCCPRITSPGIKHLVSALKKFKHLKALDLNFRLYNGTNLSSKIRSLLSSMMQRPRGSEGFKISSKGLSMLCHAIKCLICLQSLTIDFSSSYLDDKSLTKIAKCLACLPHLNTLRLNLSYCEISDNGINYLVSAISEHNKLTKLTLELAYNLKITDEGIKNLSLCLKEVKGLSHLELSFYGLIRLTQTTVEVLSKDIQGMKSLQHIILDLQGCRLCSEKSIIEEATSHIQSREIRDPSERIFREINDETGFD